MGRPPKERVEDEVQEGFGSDDYKLFESEVTSALDGEIMGEVCTPKGHGTGSIKLDMLLTQAIPQGFIHEIFALNGVGKTTLALEILGQAQKKGCRVAYLDLEGTLNKTLVASIRTLDTNKKDAQGNPLWIYKEGLIKTKASKKDDEGADDVKVMTGEEALKYVKIYCSMFKNSYIVIDSVDSIVPANILEGKDIGDATMGSLGKLMTDAMRRLHGLCKKNNNTAIFINQMRDSLKMFGTDWTTPGGHALRFYTFQRLRLTRTGKSANLTDASGKIIGHTIKVEPVKNKIPNTANDVDINLVYGRGIDREQEIVELGQMYGIVKNWKEGDKEFKSMLDLEGNKVRESAASTFLYENPKISEIIEQKVRKLLEI